MPLFIVASLLLLLPGSISAQELPPPPPPPTVTTSAVSATTPHDTPVSIQFNGTTTSGSLTYSTTTDPVHGTLAAIAGNTVLYTPSAGYVGTDTFMYRAFSTPMSQTALVTITITGSDTTAPIITAPVTQYFSTTTIPAFPALVAATSTDDTDPSPMITNDAPSSFPVGTTTITWTATDASGNHSSITSEVGITQVPTWKITSDRSTALTTESFVATAMKFDGTSSYIPASGAVIGVVLGSSTSTIIATSTADAGGQATFALSTPGSYLIGLEPDTYVTTTPITITAPVVPDPVPTPIPIGNGPPVPSTLPAAVIPTLAPSPEPVTTTPSPIPVADTTPTPHAVVTPKKVSIAKPAAPAEAPPAPEAPAAPPDTQLAAAATVTSGNYYELLGLIIVLLALAGLLWQWKKRRERAQ
jgi:hypothetical protein